MPEDENETTEEKKELFQREEIRTMHKDIARLREEEAQKEKERITRLRVEEGARRAKEIVERQMREAEEQRKATEAAEVVPEPPPAAKPDLVVEERKLPRPLSRLEKILVRAIIVIIFIFIVSFCYWYFGVRSG